MGLVIGVDADGVLTDLSAFNIREGKKYFKKEPINPNAYYTRDIFGVSKKQEDFYGLRGALNKYCKEEPPRNGAVDTINAFANKGVKFHEITARKFTTYNGILGKYYRKLFENWLNKYNFKFESIEYCSEKYSLRDKLMGCSKLKVDLMIEDKPDIAMFLANNGIKVLLFDAPYNKEISHNNIIRVKDWYEISDIINNELIKDHKTEFRKLSLSDKEKLNTNEKKEYYREYHRYLKSININMDKINRGIKNFKLIYNISYLPVRAIFHPKVENKHNVPYQDGFIIASNHLSSNDQYIISYALGKKYYAGFAASTIENTFRGNLFKLTSGAVFIDRNDSVSKQKGEEELTLRLINGNNVLIFPEGTRKNKDKEGLQKEQLPFKMGTLSIAQKTGSPILPTSIYYGKNGNYVKFGDLFYVSELDDLIIKKEQLENKILEMTRKSVYEDESKQKLKKRK